MKVCGVAVGLERFKPNATPVYRGACGRGWIAIALVIFATWNPARAVIGALLFGGVNAIQFRLQAEGTTISANLLNMTPYILTVVVLALVTYLEAFRKRVGAPAALGLPYNREERV